MWKPIRAVLDGIGTIGTWWGGLILVGGALAWAASYLEVLGSLGWAELFFLGLGAACILAFGFLAVAVGWRLFRPLPRAESPEVDPGALSAIHDRLGGIEGRLAALEDTSGKLASAYDGLTRSLDRRFRGVDQGFKAIHDREVLLRLSDKIASRASELIGTVPEHGDAEAWALWKAGQHEWRGWVDDWVEIASAYDFKAAEDIKPSERQYEIINQLPPERFPDHAALQSYKSLRAMRANLHSMEPQVMRAVLSAAYSSPSMKSRID